MQGAIKEGYLVFVSDGTQGVGSVRQVEPDGRPELLVYIENAGDFVVPFSAVDNVHSEKVMLNIDKLDSRLREAIAHASDAEDEDYVSHSAEADDRNAALSREFIDRQRKRLGALRDQVDARRLRVVERALQKIDEGTYGLSDASGKPIPKDRLESTPEAILTAQEEQREENRPNCT